MNANVARGVGGEDEGSLQDDLMAQTVNETVYLGRASFRITHEIEAVQVDEPASDSSTWFSHNAAVILKGGPNGLAMRQAPLTELAPEAEPGHRRPGRGRWWLLVALPLGAFALGMVVAPFAGSSALRRRAQVIATQAPSAVTVAPPGPAATPATSVSAQALAPAAAGVAATTTVAAAPAPATAPAAAAAPAPAAALPSSTLAVATPPVVAAAGSAEPQRAPTPSATARQGRTAKARVVRKPKAEQKVEHSGPSEAAEAEAMLDQAAASDDAAPPAAKSVAKKPAATKWIDPWAN